MMTCTRIFLDSSVIVEYLKDKDAAVDLIEHIMARPDIKAFINDIVYSEVAYIFIRTKAGKSHLTLKKDTPLVSKISEEFLNSAYPTLKTFELLPVNMDVISKANEFMTQYGLLPNDALILATCKHYRIDCLASFDEDFEEPCKEEKINLIKSLQDLKTHLNRL